MKRRTVTGKIAMKSWVSAHTGNEGPLLFRLRPIGRWRESFVSSLKLAQASRPSPIRQMQSLKKDSKPAPNSCPQVRGLPLAYPQGRNRCLRALLLSHVTQLWRLSCPVFALWKGVPVERRAYTPLRKYPTLQKQKTHLPCLYTQSNPTT